MKLEYLLIIAAIIVIAFVLKFGKIRAPLANATEQDIHDALRDGNKILAIKYYRVINNCSLTEAKQAIDAISNKLSQDSPHLSV